MLECKYDYDLKKGLVHVILNGSIRSDDSLEIFSDVIAKLSDNMPEAGIDVVFDFSMVKLINSSGIGKMLLFNKFLLDSKSKLYIKGLSPALRQLFQFARIEDSVPLINDLSEVQ